MRGLKQILLGTIAIVAATLRPDCWAFSRDYHDYEVVSANGEYFAKVRFDGEGSPKFAIYRKGTEAGEDAKLWEAELWAPIGESVLVSDDGQSVVLEDNYPYALRGLYFYHLGELKRAYIKLEMFKFDDSANQMGSARNPFSMSSQMFRTPAIAFLTTFEGRGVYARWHEGSSDWLAWEIASGEELKVAEGMSERLSTEGERICQKRLKGSRLTQAHRGPFRVSFESAIVYLAEHRTPGWREFVSPMLSNGLYNVRAYASGAQFRGLEISSSDRKLADRLLAKAEGRVPARESQRFYLGNLSATVRLPSRPTRGSLTIVAVRDAGSGLWPTILPAETIFVTAEELKV